ncbi:UDP-glucuronosyl/UDP-glucosyltransferase [Artemisia annua]|uniref:Glycosyltransferase n=1 Tax=Artemisia annua TaxID=35608 RepID=A0A2U1NNY6_ARTAN|nr:UDP-glucuronosyl/UDP-glucosyltransferase [Artemisia annua]
MEQPLNKQNIIMLQFMAQGHLIPFLELAYNMLNHNQNIIITIANSPLNINYLRSAVAKHAFVTLQLHLKSLPFNSSDHGLPPNSENTDGLTLAQMIKLFTASLALEPAFRGFLSNIIAGGGSPPVIISDVFMGWANEVAKDMGIRNYSFTTGGAYGTVAYCSIWLNLPHKNLVTGETYDQFHLPGFPDMCRFEISQLNQFLQAADGKDEWSRFFQTHVPLSMESNGWLCNTVEEIETLGLEVLRNYNTISETQMMELAKGLEESKKPFIWVIRPPIGFDLKGEFRPEWLPLGFEDRIGKQGLMVHNWAPQLEILCHRSTGAFLTHCGWNSVMESLSQGVPLIGWPLAAEQGYNAKMLVEEMGVCVVLTRGVHSRLEKEEVRSVIEAVMDKSEDGKGESMRRKASELGDMIRTSIQMNKGSSYKAMNDFMSTIISRSV